MSSFSKFNAFVNDIAEKVHNLGSDTLKIMLTNTAPIAANAVLTDITEIGTGNGYSAGGSAITVTASSQTSGVYKLVANDLTFTASGGSIGPFRYAVLYNSTAGSHNLIGFWDRGSSLTLADTDQCVIDLDQTNGILQLT